MVLSQRASTGRRGEDAAVSYLKQRGYRIVARNVRTPYGEIDIIARSGDRLVFVEVKTRTGERYGTPEEAMTGKKLRHMVRAVEHYRNMHPGAYAVQIDVVAISWDPVSHSPLEIRHIPHVFP